jgi:hypothetical protein
MLNEYFWPTYDYVHGGCRTTATTSAIHIIRATIEVLVIRVKVVMMKAVVPTAIFKWVCLDVPPVCRVIVVWITCHKVLKSDQINPNYITMLAYPHIHYESNSSAKLCWLSFFVEILKLEWFPLKDRHFKILNFWSWSEQFKIFLRLEKEMRLVDKCLKNFLMPFFWADCVKKWRNKCRTGRTFSCVLNTQLLALFKL